VDRGLIASPASRRPFDQLSVQRTIVTLGSVRGAFDGRKLLGAMTMQEQVAVQLNLETRLQRAINNNEFRLHYQPIVTVQTGRIEGFEALVRWQPPDSDLVSPAAFIPAAERSGLIVPISIFVLAEGCLAAASWHAKYPDDPPLYVCLNVSARHVSHPSFIGHMNVALGRAEFVPTASRSN
jgi:sensor c-di-GMP phosphodiesterase-like protein